MIDSPRRNRSLVGRAAVLAAALLLGTACETDDRTDPSISADVERNSGGALEAITVKGKGFSANGPVLMTALMTATSGNAGPYTEEEIQADGSGEITFERRPMACPQPADYKQGSWVRVIARDTNTGKSSAVTLNPGGEPDCRA